MSVKLTVAYCVRHEIIWTNYNVFLAIPPYWLAFAYRTTSTSSTTTNSSLVCMCVTRKKKVRYTLFLQVGRTLSQAFRVIPIPPSWYDSICPLIYFDKYLQNKKLATFYIPFLSFNTISSYITILKVWKTIGKYGFLNDATCYCHIKISQHLQ